MTDTKLLPCPFCGGEAQHFEDLMQGTFDITTHCFMCVICGGHSGWQDSHNKAFAIWNTRTADDIPKSVWKATRNAINRIKPICDNSDFRKVAAAAINKFNEEVKL